MLMRKTYIKVDSWYRYNYLGSVIKGKKLGIIGYGRVGQQLHKIAEGFGMKVYAYDLLNNNALNEVLTNSDIISLHTSMNLGLPPVLGEEEIIAIKPGSYLVNTSRGYAIDEAALIKHSSKFNGIALDVLCGEPNPPNFETFKAMGNVYVTPHIAGCTSEDMITTSNHCLDKLLKLLKERGLK
jgi:D-3-phosphoglycerate dehydrogenase